MRSAARNAALTGPHGGGRVTPDDDLVFVGLETLEPRTLLSGTIAAIDLVSLAYNGDQGNDDTLTPAISADGRYVAFVSAADNLVADDDNNVVDVFVYDRVLDVIERVSVGAGGVEANERSVRPSISADGRYVVFESLATNLDGVVNENNNWDVFVHDRLTGVTEQISVASGGVIGGEGASGEASISADGRYVAFMSNSSNLVAGDGNHVADVFLRDRVNNTTIRVSRDTGGQDANGASGQAYITGNGQWIVFSSVATDLVADDDNGLGDVFRYEVATGQIVRVSLNALGHEANGASNNPTISEDGRYAAFESFATNFAAGDADGITDVFVKDMVGGGVERISRNLSGVEGNGHSSDAQISADGAVVVFHSFASDLVASDTNNAPDVFAFKRATQEMIRVSTDAAGNQSFGFAVNAAVSGNGNVVVFESDGMDLVSGDANNRADIFAAQLTTAATFLPSDFNGDGLINTEDINPFILALTDPAGYAATFPLVDLLQVDPNGDGLINTEDINYFIFHLTGGGLGSGQSQAIATADTSVDEEPQPWLGQPASAEVLMADESSAAPSGQPQTPPVERQPVGGAGSLATSAAAVTARSLLDTSGDAVDVLAMLA